MSENRIKKYPIDTKPPAGPMTAGIWCDEDGSPGWNPDGTARQLAPLVWNFPLDANTVDRDLMVAPIAFEVLSLKYVPTTAGTGGAATFLVKKASGTTAIGSGTSLHASGSFDFVGTVNTVQTATLSATEATLQLAAGDRLGIDITGTLTSVVGTLTVFAKQI